MYHFSFPEDFKQLVFSIVSELLDLTSREWYGEENFLFQELVFMDVHQSKMREIVLEQQQCEPISTSLNDANDGKWMARAFSSKR